MNAIGAKRSGGSGITRRQKLRDRRQRHEPASGGLEEVGHDLAADREELRIAELLSAIWGGNWYVIVAPSRSR